MKSRVSTADLGAEDKKRLELVLPGDGVDVHATGVPDSICREFEWRAMQDVTQKVLFPVAATITGSVASMMGMMLWLTGSGAWVPPVVALVNVLIETVGHGVAQTKFSAYNACNAKLADYYNALLEEGYAQACCNMVKQVDRKLMTGGMLEAEELAALMVITPGQPAWSEAGIGLQITILQARQIVAFMRRGGRGESSLVTFADLDMNVHNPVHREIVLEQLLENRVSLAEDHVRHVPYMVLPVEVFEKTGDGRVDLFETVKTILWGSLRGIRSAYFAEPPRPVSLPEQVVMPAPVKVTDLEDRLIAYEGRMGRAPELPSLRW